MFKEKLTKIFSIAAAMIIFFSLMGCEDNSKDGKIIIRMTHTQQPESISDLTAKEFKNMWMKNQMEEFVLKFIRIVGFLVEI